MVRGPGAVEDGRVAVEIEVIAGEHRERCVAVVAADRVAVGGEEAVSALAHAAAWTIETHGSFGRKGIRLPTRGGPLQVTEDLVDEARGEPPVGAGDLVAEFVA